MKSNEKSLKQLVDLEKDYFKKIDLVRQPILNFCLSRIFNKCDAEDVCQEVVFILIAKSNVYDPNKNFHAWAFRIARFQILKYFSENKRSRLVFIGEDYGCLGEGVPTESPINKEKINKIKKIAFQNCINNLSPSLKAVADLRFNQDYSIKKISTKVKRSMGAVTATIHRVKEYINKNIQVECKKVEIDLDNS
jgi:RNA polymerase sigma-70 factor, ECF subfamily